MPVPNGAILRAFPGEAGVAGQHRIVVSAENNGYVGWQCKVFYYSCVTHTSFQPLFVVHALGSEWHPDFYDLVKAGALVRCAPTYTQTPYDWYVPKNTAGTLLHAAEFCDPDDLIVLCDPDMIFVRSPAFPGCLSGDHYSYLNYDRPTVRTAADRLDIAWEAILERHESLCCGVPYVVPAAQARPLAHAWLAAVDAIPPRHWEDVMYAFGLAALRLGLPITLTRIMEQDYVPEARFASDMIHYCYGNALWDKRNFFREEEMAKVWHPAISAERDTILGEILAQIAEARRFFAGAAPTAAINRLADAPGTGH
jgi:hypothetical protein